MIVRGPRIGDVTLDNPLVLAPMAGCSDLPFRRIAREMGCALAYSEMISAKALTFRNPRTEDLIRIAPDEHPIAIQIFGREPEIMARAAALVESVGADILDINMGCPTPKIVKNGEGAALMRDPGLAAEIVRACTLAVKIPVIVKMRKGWDAESVNAPQLAVILAGAGAKAIAIHGRTRDQFYSGKADWEIIRRVKESVPVPVIGNGDIRGAEDAKRMLDETGCDAVMIGRAALGNPWIFRETLHFLKTNRFLPEPSVRERIELAIRHLDMMVEYKGEHSAVSQMRKHMAWYIHGIRGAARIRDIINQARTRDEMVSAVTTAL